MIIDQIFQVPILVDNNILSNEENNILFNRSIELESKYESSDADWVGGTYSTYSTDLILIDTKFSNVINKITERVHSFASHHGCSGKYECHEGWININRKYTFQEYHNHPGSIISAVYYISAPEGSGRIQFQDPKEDMMPLKDIKEFNTNSFKTAVYPCEEGQLLIFRSYLKHLVHQGLNQIPRVSLALNFK